MTATPLAHELLKQCGYDEFDYIDDLGQASEIYQDEKSEHELVSYLIDVFTATDVTLAQETISTLPWQRIYTTNYDNIVELSYQKNKKNILSPVLSENPKQYFGKKCKLCVHLNGKVDKLSTEKLNGEFKLTNRSYLTTDFLDSNWLSIFRTDLKSARAIFFIGYSMKYDLDLQRTIYEGRVRDKTFFITKEDESKSNVKYMEKYGCVLSIGVENFSNKIVECRKTYYPITRVTPILLCFDVVSIPKTPKSILDKDIFELLYGGSLQADKLYYSLLSPEDYPYCVYRSKLDDAIAKIDSGEKRLLIHSELGNGKTVFLNSLESKLVQSGYQIYHFLRYRTTVLRELEMICTSHEKVVIVFDDYVGNAEILKILAPIITDQIIILTERTAVNDANYHLLSDKFGEFYHININQLDDEEVDDFIYLLNYYGLWHEWAAQSDLKKKKIIVETCHRKIGSLILKLLESKCIISKYQAIVNKIKNKDIYYDAILFMLIAHISKLNLDLDDISNALDTSKLNTPSFKKDPIVNEFIDFETDEVKQKSSIISEFILRKIVDSSTVVDVMIKIFKRLTSQMQDNATRQILRKMMTFTNVQHILNKQDPNFSANVLYLYETIGKLDFCRRNPHYWLQYAIVMLSQYQYQQADAYFKNAYAYAKEIPDFDTYQIDNHHARFILENEREYGTNETCMSAFQQAHKILMDPKHKRDVRHYPFRVAQNYYSFYEKFYNGMTIGERKSFLTACDEMLGRISWYESTTSDVNRDVRKAKDSLLLIKKEITRVRVHISALSSEQVCASLSQIKKNGSKDEGRTDNQLRVRAQALQPERPGPLDEEVLQGGGV